MKRFKGLNAGIVFGGIFVMLMLLVVLFALIGGLGISFWLLLAVTPGMIMLMTVVSYYRRYPSETLPGPFSDPLAGRAPETLEHFQRSTMEQLADISATLSNKVLPLNTVRGTDQAHGTGRSDSLATNPAIGIQPDAGRAQSFVQLAEKMQHLADLTTHMLEKSQTLTRNVEPGAALNSTLDSQYLSFTLDGMPFALSLLNVHALVEATQLTPKPGRSSQSRAVRLGSSLVPVIDLGAHFGGQPIKIDISTHIVIVDVSLGDRWQRVGIVTERVGRILDIPWTQIVAPTTSGDRIGNEFVLGTAMVNAQSVTLLDIERVLLASESIVLRAPTPPEEQDELLS
ncbi:chemotaxis protein CheW [Pseudomonas sp. B21-028]|uniref:chemotaxis protein CheW n=1 Tax=Pseudomonas sp. B21-028 TaxID=2895480 RepID=UPI00215ED5F1|nr:chemotaxis protein CheW [Pseudomonas sp. B21-028]UVL86475.1 chemotaxis protein CheW [Pseudomonas sp. B21-028]